MKWVMAQAAPPPAPRSGGAILWRASIICYHVHGGSYCDIGGIHELPSKQMDYVGRSGTHRPNRVPRIVRLAGRRDATSTVNHYSVLPGRLHPRKWIGDCCLIARQTPQCKCRSYGLDSPTSGPAPAGFFCGNHVTKPQMSSARARTLL